MVIASCLQNSNDCFFHFISFRMLILEEELDLIACVAIVFKHLHPICQKSSGISMKPLKIWMNIFLFLQKAAFSTMVHVFFLPLIHDIGLIWMGESCCHFTVIFQWIRDPILIQSYIFRWVKKKKLNQLYQWHCENDVSVLTATVIDFGTNKLFVMIVSLESWHRCHAISMDLSLPYRTNWLRQLCYFVCFFVLFEHITNEC